MIEDESWKTKDEGWLQGTKSKETNTQIESMEYGIEGNMYEK